MLLAYYFEVIILKFLEFVQLLAALLFDCYTNTAVVAVDGVEVDGQWKFGEKKMLEVRYSS
jgi:hypothetical protein